MRVLSLEEMKQVSGGCSKPRVVKSCTSKGTSGRSRLKATSGRGNTRGRGTRGRGGRGIGSGCVRIC